MTACLMIPKAAKSQAIATRVTIKAKSEKREATREPRMLVPRQSKKAKKVRPAAIGCRIMTFVRALALSRSALENETWVTCARAAVAS